MIHTLELLLIPVGIFLLYLGGHLLVSSGVALSIRLAIPKYVIGATIIAIGTSMPELFSVLAASRDKESTLVFSSLLGSNIFNIAAVLSITLLLRKNIIKKLLTIERHDALSLFAAGVLPFVFAFVIGKGKILLPEGIVFLLVFLVYEYMIIRKKDPSLRSETDISPQEKKTTPPSSKGQHPLQVNFLLLQVSLIIIAAIMLSYGGELVVASIQNILNRTERNTQFVRFLAVSIIAVGTSLPELVTSLVALQKKENEVLLGNIVGSCIVNTLFILPIAGFIFPIIVDTRLILDALYVIILHLWVLSFSWIPNNTSSIRIQGGIALLSIAGYFYILVSTLRF